MPPSRDTAKVEPPAPVETPKDEPNAKRCRRGADSDELAQEDLEELEDDAQTRDPASFDDFCCSDVVVDCDCDHDGGLALSQPASAPSTSAAPTF